MMHLNVISCFITNRLPSRYKDDKFILVRKYSLFTLSILEKAKYIHSENLNNFLTLNQATILCFNGLYTEYLLCLLAL
jgi:hypothetical protein